MNTPPTNFVYQRLHVLKGRALHLAGHLRVAARAYEHIYGVRPDLDERVITAQIADTVRGRQANSHTGATVILRLAPGDDPSSRGTEGNTPSLRGAEGDEAIRISATFERSLLDAGYAHSALRPRAVSYDYGLPFAGFPTGFHLAARELFDTLAFRQHGATRSVRRRGDVLLTCGDSPLFAIRGRVLFTTPLTEGAMDSVEREMVIDAAGKARLSVREEPILHAELKSYDELFLADAAGITSLAECDGAQFMSLVAPRLATVISG